MTPSIQQIQERACEVFGFSMQELFECNRLKSISKPRQLLMRWCVDLGYRHDAIDKAFKRKRGSSQHAFDCSEESFTKLELERMEQVKASFETLPFVSGIMIESISTMQPELRLIRHSPSISDYETRIECWRPQRNNVA